MNYSGQAQRLIQDFQHGGKLGPNNTRRLLELVASMADALDKYEREREARGRQRPDWAIKEDGHEQD